MEFQPQIPTHLSHPGRGNTAFPLCPAPRRATHLYSVVLEGFLVPGISSPFFTQ